MQVGVNNLATNSRSVGQRIKDASLKDISSFANTATSFCATNEQTHASSQNVSLPAGKTNRTTAASFCMSCDKRQQHHFLQASPIMLSEVQKNTVRVIGQYLRDLGMSDTVDSLVEESGCRIENPLSVQLCDHVINGAWNKALEIIEKFRPSIAEKQYLTARVLLLEEKFKDLLINGEILLALRLIQLEYPKNAEIKYRLERWANVLCSQNPAESCKRLNNNNNSHHNRPCNNNDFSSLSFENSKAIHNKYVLDVLRKLLPPSLMLPPNRLQELLKQSWLHQVKQCDFHILSNDDAMERSILVDHQCTSNEFPSKHTATLYLHNSEVWCLAFSPCGRFLASGAKGNNVLIWKVESPSSVTIHLNITIHQDIVGIASISWSYDSRYLAIATTEENNYGIFVYCIRTGRLFKEYCHYPTESFSCVSFFANRSHKLACGDQRGHFSVYDIHRSEDPTLAFEGFRIRCIYAMRDGRTVLGADTHNRIRSYDFETKNEQTLIQENSQIMYFSVDRNEKYCSVTTKTEGIRLWCLKTCSLIRTFFGANHSEFVIGSSFGGHESNFLASGSEDESVIIWNISNSQPIRKLTGHTGTVNTVAWNPIFHGMLASGSDDGTIKIWSTNSSPTQSF